MKKTLLAGLAVGAMIVGMTGVANATYINFTSSTWSGADNQDSYGPKTIGGVDITLSTPTANQSLTYDSNDGIGINTKNYNDTDKIDTIYELLKVSFAPDVMVTKLYLDEVSTGEKIAYSFDGTTWTIKTASGSTITDGDDLIITTNNTGAESFIEFMAPTYVVSHTYFHDGQTYTYETTYNSSYTLEGLDIEKVNAVPEPATMLLFGAGIAGLAGVARRKRS